MKLTKNIIIDIVPKMYVVRYENYNYNIIFLHDQTCIRFS